VYDVTRWLLLRICDPTGLRSFSLELCKKQRVGVVDVQDVTRWLPLRICAPTGPRSFSPGFFPGFGENNHFHPAGYACFGPTGQRFVAMESKSMNDTFGVRPCQRKVGPEDSSGRMVTQGKHLGWGNGWAFGPKCTGSRNELRPRGGSTAL
jgi:hypothetical protein